MMNKGTLRPGFSLIELMVYMAIVGFLVAGATVAYSTLKAKGRKSATVTGLRAISQAIDTYNSDTNRYPEVLEDLVQQPSGIKNWEGPYVALKGGEFPKDGWGNDFHYEKTPGKIHPYELYSGGTNGEDAPEEEWISAWN